MRKRVTALVIAGFSLPLVAQTQGTQTLLDLTTPSEQIKREEVFSGSKSLGIYGGGVGSAAVHKLLLRLTLMELDRTAYRRFDPVEFQVLIENIGTVPLMIPWSGQTKELAAKSMTDTVRAVIALHLRDSAGRLHYGTGASLWGAADPPESMNVLRPGEKAVVKAPAEWLLLDKATADWWQAAAPSQVEVVATLSIDEGMRVTYEMVTSANHLEITLLGR
jgi:hypothetical protein